MPRLRHKKTAVTRLVLAAVLLSGSVLLLWGSTLRIPDLASFEQRKVEQSTKIYDRTGEILLYDVHENITRTVVPFSDISRNIKNATVAVEDAEFYEHRGIKVTAIIRAVVTNLFNFQLLSGQGGSTLTQQVVKNSILTKDKTITRKLKEWILALKLEQVLSKEEILELYLNETPYGGSIYGVEEASQAFFGKSASDVTIAESAYLAALPQAPTFYSPYGNNRDQLEGRKDFVLGRMFEDGFITEDEYKVAQTEEVLFQPREKNGIVAPHFVFFVEQYLENKYGRRAVEERGLRVITTLDYDLQQKGEEIVNRFALENEEKFNAENAGLVAIDPKTGHILVMVGSRDYFDTTIDGNFNVTLAKRQPGSAFKPFVYAAAFKRGYTPETVVFDTRTQFSTLCSPENLTSNGDCYSPVNYDNTFRGPVSFREALAQSINVPAVKVLYLAGLSDALRTARDMGIQTLTDISRYGLTLVLGGGEVTLLDITSAYGVFGNGGVRNPHSAILRVEDSSGNVLEEFSQNPISVLDENIALTINDMLSDNVARTPAFGANSALYFPGRDVAVKTGTTDDYRDAWIIGYTPNVAVGAWAGNNDNSPMEKRVAGFIIAPLWNTFMYEALSVFPDEQFLPPLPDIKYDTLKPTLRGIWQGGETFVIDKASGKLATEFTPDALKEEHVIPSIHSILQWVNRADPRGPYPETPEEDPQFVLWERGVARWLAQNPLSFESPTIPEEKDDVHLPEYQPRVAIKSPDGASSYSAAAPIAVSITSQGHFRLKKAEYFIDGRLVGTAQRSPFSFSFTPADLGLASGEHTLRVVLSDTVLNQGEASQSFRIE